MQDESSVLIVRLARRDKGTQESPDAVLSEFEESKRTLVAQEGFLAASLHQEAHPESPYRFMTLTSWESAAKMGTGAPAMGTSDAHIGLYRPILSLGRDTRPAVGSYSVVVGFKWGEDVREAVQKQVVEFTRPAQERDEWGGTVLLAPASGSPHFGLISITSWTSLEAAHSFHSDSALVQLFQRVAAEGWVAPDGVSFMRVISH